MGTGAISSAYHTIGSNSNASSSITSMDQQFSHMSNSMTEMSHAISSELSSLDHQQRQPKYKQQQHIHASDSSGDGGGSSSSLDNDDPHADTDSAGRLNLGYISSFVPKKS